MFNEKFFDDALRSAIGHPWVLLDTQAEFNI